MLITKVLIVFRNHKTSNNTLKLYYGVKNCKIMKKSLLIFSFVLLGVTVLNSCGSNSAKEKPSATKEVASVQYTCPMHSEVISDKPGDCPKCGMALVEKK